VSEGSNRDVTFGPSPDQFVWATGVENTFVPQTRPGHRSLDEFALMSHYKHWKDDLRVCADLGVRAIRWGPPWYRVEPQPQVFDWSWTDEVIPYLEEELKIVPIVDLIHYGCPYWLEREFVNNDYPVAVATYAKEFAKRYSSVVRFYTPLNEPVVNALMCGKRGLWPPYLRGDAGYIRIMLQLVSGIVKTAAAIREVDSSAKLVFVEAAGLSRAAHADLEPLAAEDQHRGYMCYDLLTGKVTRDHPLYTWLLRNGATHKALAEIARNPVHIDILGLNFYPQWSVKQLYINRNGRVASRVFDGHASFSSLIEDYYRRYRIPIMITETSAFGSDEIRAAWLQQSIAAIKALRQNGVPVYGYTWFPVHTMIDWRYRFGTEPAENYKIELGLYRLGAAGNNPSRWEPTALVEYFRQFAADPKSSIGYIADSLVEARP
jgi:beta-glucosidase